MIKLNLINRDILERKEYEYLKTDKNLKDNLMFLTVWGSLAYGTATNDSDLDIRGITFNTRKQLLGLDNYSCYDSDETDTTIYGLKRFTDMLMKGSANAIELLGCSQDCFIYTTSESELLIKNRKLFISKAVATEFRRYALSLIMSLKSILAKQYGTDEDKDKQIIELLNIRIKEFNESNENKIGVSLKLLDNQIVCDMSTKDYPIGELRKLFSDMRQISESMKNLKQLKKRDNKKINKQAMHAVRVMLTAIDILNEQDIITRRTKDLPLLTSIRDGKYMLDSGMYSGEYFELFDELCNLYDKAFETTELQDTADIEKIETLMAIINKI